MSLNPLNRAYGAISAGASNAPIDRELQKDIATRQDTISIGARKPVKAESVAPPPPPLVQTPPPAKPIPKPESFIQRPPQDLFMRSAPQTQPAPTAPAPRPVEVQKPVQAPPPAQEQPVQQQPLHSTLEVGKAGYDRFIATRSSGYRFGLRTVGRGDDTLMLRRGRRKKDFEDESSLISIIGELFEKYTTIAERSFYLEHVLARVLDDSLRQQMMIRILTQHPELIPLFLVNRMARLFEQKWSEIQPKLDAIWEEYSQQMALAVLEVTTAFKAPAKKNKKR